MPGKIVTIKNKLGFHARAASAFVKLSSRFKSKVMLHKNGQQVNGKSILGIMTLAASKGSQLEITTQGQDADTALNKLVALVDDGFGED